MLIIFDGNSIAHRLYHGLKVEETQSFGTMVSKFYGIVENCQRAYQSDHAAIVWDSDNDTWRHRTYPDYKKGRKPATETLKTGVDRIKKATRIDQCEIPGWEADDIINTMVSSYDGECLIYSSDKDFFQLVSSRVSILSQASGVVRKIDEREVFRMFGLMPVQLADFKSLVGDKSDNIKGVPGIGEVVATQLLTDYLRLDTIYENLESIRPAIAKKLEAGKESAYFSKRLVGLTSAPVEMPWLSSPVLQM